MYRILYGVFFYMSVVSSAPQDSSYLNPLPTDLTAPYESREPDPPIIDIDNETEDDSEAKQEEIETTTKRSSAEVTEAVEPETDIVTQTEAYEIKVKSPSPRFIPKLSFFQRANENSPAARVNFFHRPVRKFVSKCRCMRYEKCEKFQSSVPRCPEEQFLCCF